MREKVLLETKSLESVYKTIGDHNNYLCSQLEQYKAYLQNVRITSTANQKRKTVGGGVGVVSVDGKEKKIPKAQALGPYKFSHAQFEKEGVIVNTNVPENRRANIFFQIVSPSPGTFIIALHYKGREKAILEMDLKINDLFRYSILYAFLDNSARLNALIIFSGRLPIIRLSPSHPPTPALAGSLATRPPLMTARPRLLLISAIDTLL
ncbi:hypothetical protein PtA15_10A526 [Puccinia triticina]|uniref:RasGAP protein C-terminal domain-containing protein n=1 Tax=Puccinia triticina TaxID=208348 RepID=A0ABY7CYM2_9BASI|nr:uncharacterized protein PtA15_10A526 [Puccinia triticina]WAQ89102.1 hypothetical protein PtA15_10A526 [Puccinia triticina]